MKFLKFLFFISLLCFSACFTFAADLSDHPLIGHIDGFVASEKKVVDYDVLDLSNNSVHGVVAEGPIAGKLKDAGLKNIEGKLTHIIYNRKDTNFHYGLNALLKNYTTTLQNLGGELLNVDYFSGQVGNYIFKVAGKGNSKPVYVILWAENDFYKLTIAEPKAENAMVSAKTISDDLSQSGKSTLHINFDTNKSVLKEDGMKAVHEIVAVLNQNPQLKLAIVGHTDNVGNAAQNLKLSMERADAVMKAVVAAGIDRQRLSATGKGSEQPVAENGTEAGKAQNRRVELIKQK